MQQSDETRFEDFVGLISGLYKEIQRIKTSEGARLGLKGSDVMCLYYLERSKDGLTGADLAGLGQLIALHEHLVKTLMIDVDAIHIHIGAKGDGQRQNTQSGVLRRRHIACGIGNNTNGHNKSFLARSSRGEF